MPALPPGPTLPAALQLARWVLDPLPFLDACQRRYGDAFTLRIPNNPPFVFFSHPEALREIFAADPEDLHASEANRVLEGVVGGNSFLLMDGRRHQRARRLLMPAFHGERMEAYGEVMRDLADRAIARWPLGRPFSLHAEMRTVALDVVMRTVFGVEGEQLARLRERLRDLVDGGQGALLTTLVFVTPPERLARLLAAGAAPPARGPRWLDPGALAPWRRLLARRREADEIFFAEVARRRATGTAGRADVLSMLLDARDDEGRPMTDQELRDQMVTLLVAGHETVATSLAWAVHHVLGAPDVQARLREELDRVVGAGPLRPEHVNRLEYLGAVLKESARLAPVITQVARKPQRPMTLGGWDLPADVFVMGSIYLAHRRPELYPEPEAFRPERFLARRAPAPHEYLPFGGGVRRCIGAAFATYEMKIVLAEVLRRARLAPAPGPAVRPARRGLTIAPSRGMPVVLEARLTPGG